MKENVSVCFFLNTVYTVYRAKHYAICCRALKTVKYEQ